MAQTVLVTGAAGFIGQRLCARLQESGLLVRALLHRSVAGPWDEAVVADLGQGELPAQLFAGVRTVYHLAGKAHALAELPGEEMEYQRVNVIGTRELLNGARLAGVESFVLFSSIKAMGEGGVNCLDETCDLEPETPYGASKKQAEQLVLQGDFVPHPVALRLAMVYGPDPKGNLNRMIAAVAQHRFPPLPETGNRRSMVHVDDVVEAALLVVSRIEAAGGLYIITDGRSYSTRQLYEWICAALGRRPPSWSVPLGLLRFLARIGDGIGRLAGRRFFFDSDALGKLTGSACYSSELIQRQLGFKPHHTLKESLAEIVRSMS